MHPRLARSAVLVLACGGGGSCTVVNDKDVCGPQGSEFRVNERGDQDEFVGHEHAASSISADRLLVAYAALSEEPETESVVRLALIDSRSGVRLSLCDTSEFEQTLSDPDEVAFAPVTSEAHFERVGGFGLDAEAIAGWVQGQLIDTTVLVLPLDRAGCPLSAPFSPGSADTMAGATGLSLGWSESRAAVIAAYHNGRSVYLSEIDEPAPGRTLELGREFAIIGNVALALDEVGGGIVVWQYAEDAASYMNGAFRLRAQLIPQQGELDENEPFDVSVPGDGLSPRGGPGVSVATRSDRHAIVSGAVIEDAPEVFLQEFDDRGEQITRPFRFTGGPHSATATVRYLPDDTLLPVWLENDGTYARLFEIGGGERFNALSCDEGSFAVGSRFDDKRSFGVPSPLVVGRDVWVFHTGNLATDPRGVGVESWRTSFDDLYPAE